MTYYVIHPGTGTILDADECLTVHDEGEYNEHRLIAAARNHGEHLPVRGIRIKLEGGLVRSVDAYDRHGVPVLPVPTDVWDYDTESVYEDEELKTDEHGSQYIEYGI